MVRNKISTDLRNSIIAALVVGAIGFANSWIISTRVQQYTLQVDSKMDMLLKLTHQQGYDQGHEAGVKGERDYQNDQTRKDLTNDATLRAIEQPTPRGKGKR